MASRYFIVVGDPTTAGGHALAGYPGGRVQCLDGVSRNVVRVGDPVLCGECGPTTVTKGHPFALLPGGLLAYDGSDLACGHKMVSKLQRLFSWDEPSHRDELSFSGSGQTSALLSQSHQTAAKYDEAFVLRSKLTGRPLANRHYRISRNGSIESGVTDERGATHLVVSDSAEDLTVHLLEEGP